MADYPNNNSGEGADDNYSDAPSASPTEAPEESEGMDTEPRGLLPKSILAGKDFKPGDEIVLKIDAIHDDEVEVSYAPEKGEGAGKEEMAEAPAPGGMGGDAEMRSMMED